MKIKKRYLTQANLKELCDEFKLKIFASKINDKTSDKNKKDNIKNNHKEFIGYEDADETRTFHFALIENHWFLDEGKTNITSDYIKFIDSAPIDAFNKRRRIKNNKVMCCKTNDSRYFLSLSDLIIKLMKKSLFKPINFASASVLKTSLYDTIKDNDFNLQCYDSCFRLIKPEEEKIKEKPLIYHAVFECDVSGKIHQPYSVVIHSDKGDVQQSFWGINCAKEFLEFLPDNSLTYFYNLAYDASCFMKYIYKINNIIKKNNRHIYKINVMYKSKHLVEGIMKTSGSSHVRTHFSS